MNGSFQSILAFSEYSYTPGPIFLDVGGTAKDSASTSAAGVTLTLSGSSELIRQWITNATGSPTAGTVVTHFATGSFTAFGDIINASVGTAPVWTTPNSTSVVAGIAFK